MPFDRSQYPDDWEEISLRIREREGNKCKWCLIVNGAIGYRNHWGEFIKVFNSIDETDLRADSLALVDGIKLIRIVLTVAHLNHNTHDNRDDNLVALCQRCHNRYDRTHRNRNSAHTRHLKRIESGQTELPLINPD